MRQVALSDGRRRLESLTSSASMTTVTHSRKAAKRPYQDLARERLRALGTARQLAPPALNMLLATRGQPRRVSPPGFTAHRGSLQTPCSTAAPVIQFGVGNRQPGPQEAPTGCPRESRLPSLVMPVEPRPVLGSRRRSSCRHELRARARTASQPRVSTRPSIVSGATLSSTPCPRS